MLRRFPANGLGFGPPAVERSLFKSRPDLRSLLEIAVSVTTGSQPTFSRMSGRHPVRIGHEPDGPPTASLRGLRR